MKDHLLMLAGYHAWSFEVMYSALASVPDEHYHADRGLFFGSIHATLNHLLLADRVWHGRLTGETYAVGGLDIELEPDRHALEQALYDQTANWHVWIEAQQDSALAATFTYRNFADRTFTDQRGAILHHVFNHGTHHRGQISAALSALGRETPELDLIVYLRKVRPSAPG